jgi:hypothetical protein
LLFVAVCGVPSTRKMTSVMLTKQTSTPALRKPSDRRATPRREATYIATETALAMRSMPSPT